MSLLKEMDLNELHCSQCWIKMSWVKDYLKEDGTKVSGYWRHDKRTHCKNKSPESVGHRLGKELFTNFGNEGGIVEFISTCKCGREYVSNIPKEVILYKEEYSDIKCRIWDIAGLNDKNEIICGIEIYHSNRSKKETRSDILWYEVNDIEVVNKLYLKNPDKITLNDIIEDKECTNCVKSRSIIPIKQKQKITFRLPKKISAKNIKMLLKIKKMLLEIISIIIEKLNNNGKLLQFIIDNIQPLLQQPTLQPLPLLQQPTLQPLPLLQQPTPQPLPLLQQPTLQPLPININATFPINTESSKSIIKSNKRSKCKNCNRSSIHKGTVYPLCLECWKLEN